jgi:hypothetical protein
MPFLSTPSINYTANLGEVLKALILTNYKYWFLFTFSILYAQFD